MLNLSILGIVLFIIINASKSKLFREHLFSYAIKITLFISDAQYHVQVNCVDQQKVYISSKLQEN